MARIADNLIELIGNTPLVELKRISMENGVETRILAKLEYFNPAGSIKDRIAYAMITDAEEKGLINKNTAIIEPTSGNTGIGLAMVCAVKGYKCILVMPETFSVERRKLMQYYGAEIVLSNGSEGMNGAVKKANALASKMPNSFIPSQFENPANPEIHKKATAEEIWKDTEGNIDIFIAGVGTGGTITGVGEALKQKKSDIKVVAVEPFDSPLLSGGEAGPHKLQGIGANFIPKILNRDIIDEVYRVKNQEAIETSRIIAKTEGLLVGISSGAAVFAAIQVAKRSENIGKNIVVILPDTGERYLSTELFN